MKRITTTPDAEQIPDLEIAEFVATPDCVPAREAPYVDIPADLLRWCYNDIQQHLHFKQNEASNTVNF